MAPRPEPTAVNSGHYDATQNASIIGVIGTLGTADVTGTAQTLPFGVDPATGAMYVNILAGAGAASNPTSGTLSTLGTVGSITNLGSFTNGGTIKEITNIAGGTITTTLALNTGTITTIAAGTQNTLGTVGVLNALAAGTITTGTVSVTTGTVVGNIASGAAHSGNPVKIAGVDSGGTVRIISTDQVGVTQVNLSNVAIGTFGGQDATSNGLTSGLFFAPGFSYNGATWDRNRVANIANNTIGTGLMGVGVLGQDSGGTYHSLALSTGGSIGTIILPNIPGGTIGVLGAGTLTTGSLSNVAMVNAGTFVQASGTTTLVSTVTTLSNLTNGSVNILTGTLQNLVTGTINALASGTITTGTVSMTTGTISPLTNITQATFGTIGTTGATIFGTLAGGTSSGAGTEIFVTSLSLTIPSTAGSQDVSIGFGTNAGTFHSGTGRLVRGNFPAGGGIQKEFRPAINSGTNAQLTYFQAGAGTVQVDITYFTTASTL